MKMNKLINYNNKNLYNLKQKNNFEKCLKKAFSIIFQYHKNKKIIMFLGIPPQLKKKYKSFFFKTKHIFLPEFYWITGLLTNKIPLFKHIKNKIKFNKQKKIKNLQEYFSINKKPDLIVIFNLELNKNLLKESSKLKIPVIALVPNFIKINDILYTIPINSKLNIIKHNKFIFNLLFSLLKKYK